MSRSKSPTAKAKVSRKADQFIASVLALGPRVAVFDCDGTLWSLDSGEQFFYWELEQGLLPPPVARWAGARYADYKAGKVEEEAICGEMVAIHKGVPRAVLQEAVQEFFATHVEPSVFPEMRELVRRLAKVGCELWAVSSTNDWVIREAARRFGIPEEHVLAACVEMENGRATDRLIHVPTDEGKATAIRKHCRSSVDAAFGNSVHDAAMLRLARHAVAVNPNSDLETLAREQGWMVYHPDGER
jgi:HAD superfamily phosphoserine phosphatase-like hydrolase